MKIAQVILSNAWGDISYDSLQKGIGGREGAMIRLAKEWAKLGHHVTNFVPTKNPSRLHEWIGKDSKEFGRGYKVPEGWHEYVPVNLAQPMLANFPYDAVVAWECPTIFASEAVREKQKVRLIHMQVAHLEDEGTAQFSTGIVALSEWARDFLIHQGIEAPNFYVRPNGVNIADYPIKKAMNKGKHPTFVYSSSPDRGLWHLLKMWPEIRKEYKKATLFVAYGVNRFTEANRWQHNRIGEMSMEIEILLQQPGVVDVGKIGQKQLAELQLKATAWLYPADTIQATETGCITAIENMAAGNPCIMSDADCLESEFSEVAWINPLPFDADEWLSQIYRLKFHPQLAEFGREFAESRDWSRIAPTWIDLFKENADAQT